MNRDPITGADHLLAQAIRSGQADACQVDQHVKAGELPITMLEDEHGPVCGSSDFTVVMNDKHARLMHLADIGATVLVEAYARRVASNWPSPVYDINTPDDEELPDDTPRAEMESDLHQAAAHLNERRLIVRPFSDSPQLVAFVVRAA